jgi:hypothetical protein
MGRRRSPVAPMSTGAAVASGFPNLASWALLLLRYRLDPRLSQMAGRQDEEDPTLDQLREGARSGKRSGVGRALDNPVLRTEGRVTLIDGMLVTAVLVGLVLNAVPGRRLSVSTRARS